MDGIGSSQLFATVVSPIEPGPIVVSAWLLQARCVVGDAPSNEDETKPPVGAVHSPIDVRCGEAVAEGPSTVVYCRACVCGPVASDINTVAGVVFGCDACIVVTAKA